MGKHAGLPWDCILSAELFHHYKRDPEIYKGAAQLLGLPIEQVMMTAAHKDDLKAARETGMRTAFVPRPGEHGPDRDIDTTNEDWIDVYASTFEELADKMGC